MAAAGSGLGEIFTSIRSTEIMLQKRREELQHVTSKVRAAEQEKQGLEDEVRDTRAAVKEANTQVHNCKLQAETDTLKAGLLTQQLKESLLQLQQTRANMDVAEEAAEECVEAFERLALEHYCTVRLEGDLLLREQRHLLTQLNELQLENNTLSCELSLLQDNARDALRLQRRCSEELQSLIDGLKQCCELLRDNTTNEERQSTSHKPLKANNGGEDHHSSQESDIMVDSPSDRQSTVIYQDYPASPLCTPGGSNTTVQSKVRSPRQPPTRGSSLAGITRSSGRSPYYRANKSTTRPATTTAVVGRRAQRPSYTDTAETDTETLHQKDYVDREIDTISLPDDWDDFCDLPDIETPFSSATPISDKTLSKTNYTNQVAETTQNIDVITALTKSDTVTLENADTSLNDRNIVDRKRQITPKKDNLLPSKKLAIAIANKMSDVNSFGSNISNSINEISTSTVRVNITNDNSRVNCEESSESTQSNVPLTRMRMENNGDQSFVNKTPTSDPPQTINERFNSPNAVNNKTYFNTSDTSNSNKKPPTMPNSTTTDERNYCFNYNKASFRSAVSVPPIRFKFKKTTVELRPERMRAPTYASLTDAPRFKFRVTKHSVQRFGGCQTNNLQSQNGSFYQNISSSCNSEVQSVGASAEGISQHCPVNAITKPKTYPSGPVSWNNTLNNYSPSRPKVNSGMSPCSNRPSVPPLLPINRRNHNTPSVNSFPSSNKPANSFSSSSGPVNSSLSSNGPYNASSNEPLKYSSNNTNKSLSSKLSSSGNNHFKFYPVSSSSCATSSFSSTHDNKLPSIPVTLRDVGTIAAAAASQSFKPSTSQTIRLPGPASANRDSLAARPLSRLQRN